MRSTAAQDVSIGRIFSLLLHIVTFHVCLKDPANYAGGAEPDRNPEDYGIGVVSCIYLSLSG